MTTALTILATGTVWLGLLAGLATGAFMGLANGLLAATNRASPFIIILGTMTFLQGDGIVISGGSPINGAGALFDVFGLSTAALSLSLLGAARSSVCRRDAGRFAPHPGYQTLRGSSGLR